MLRKSMKVVVVLATTAVIMPYAVALLSHMMWGWPRNYRRALSPRKVYMLNYSLLLQVKKVKYTLLKLKWMYFYKNAKANRLLKDLQYGSNSNHLDLYMPLDPAGLSIPGPRPVIVFLFGGSWSSGDKEMYGLLCSQLADNTQAIVCCPNYSIYPKGLVDDMVQDVVDCVDWLRENVHKHDGDKHRIALVGHSAGSHLAMMAVLELVQKGLIHNPDSIIMSSTEAALVTSQSELRQPSSFSQSFVFEEGHFAPSSRGSCIPIEGTSSAGSGSFYMVQSRARQLSASSLDEKQGSDPFVVVGDESNGSNISDREALSIGSIEEVEHPAVDQEEKGEVEEEEEGLEEKEEAVEEREEAVEEKDEIGKKEEETKDEPGEPKPSELPEVHIEPTEEMQTQAADALSSIKLVIGLAGVYDISDHYDHEAWRGIDDVSKMSRAMFGPQHFQRFSPTFIVRHLPKNTRLPAIQLIHGDVDRIVPNSSSMIFGKALWDLGCRNVRYSVIPQCDHYQICVDLMEPGRDWHAIVIGEIMQAVKYHL